MIEQNMTLAALAEIGALRRLIVQALALRLLEEDTPEHALSMLGLQLMQSGSVPPDGHTGLDPAVSDLLAAMTDDSLQGLFKDLGQAVSAMTGGTSGRSLPI